MKIEQTTDVDFIVECVMASWDQTSDDGSPPKELWFPEFGEQFIWIRAEDYGVFLLTKLNFVLFEVHTVLLPSAHGHAVEIAKAALSWVWENTDAKRIVTNVPAFNLLALRLARKVGFNQYGVNVKSFQRKGYLYDQLMLGTNKEN